MLTPLDVLPAMSILAGIGMATDSAEVLAARRALSPAGTYSWAVLGAGRRYLVRGPWSRPLQTVFAYPAVLSLQWVQLGSAVLLVSAFWLPEPTQRLAVAVGALAGGSARLLFYMRQQLGLDGADQMLSIVLLSCGFGAAFGDTMAGYAAVSYAALQLCLSYVVSGSAKARSRTWRSGAAIVGITGTVGYGNAWVHRLLSAHRWLARLLCWSVIGFECGAVLLLLGGVPGALLLVAAGLAFHVGVAVVMGLNTFVWAFAASYPAVVLVSDHLHAFVV